MIIVTRPSLYGEELVELCNSANLPAKHLPFFNIIKDRDLDRLQGQLDRLSEGDIVIAVSPQVVLMLQQQEPSVKFPHFVHYFAVGKQTATLLQAFSKQTVAYPPHKESSEGLLNYLQSIKLDLKQRNVLILSGDISRSVLQQQLNEQEAIVNNIHCYRREEVIYPPTIFAENQCSYFIITSVEHLLRLELYCDQVHKQKANLIVSSDRIYQEAQKRGWQHIYLTSNANNQNLFKTMTSLCHNKVNLK